MQVFPDTIGLRKDGREHLLTYATTVFNAFGPRNQLFEDSNNAAKAAIAWVNEACQRANLVPGGWGMSVFEAADCGERTEAEAERLVRSFLSAGVDTTVNGIGHMLLAFATNADAWQLVRNKPALARTVFDEILRWDSTVQTFFRTTTCQTTVADVVIPSGSKVVLFLASANRDPCFGKTRIDSIPGERMRATLGLGMGSKNASAKCWRGRKQRWFKVALLISVRRCDERMVMLLRVSPSCQN